MNPWWDRVSLTVPELELMDGVMNDSTLDGLLRRLYCLTVYASGYRTRRVAELMGLTVRLKMRHFPWHHGGVHVWRMSRHVTKWKT